jgi:hypothetical protein
MGRVGVFHGDDSRRVNCRDWEPTHAFCVGKAVPLDLDLDFDVAEMGEPELEGPEGDTKPNGA